MKKGMPSYRPDRPAQGKEAVDFSRCIRSGDLSFWQLFLWMGAKEKVQEKIM